MKCKGYKFNEYDATYKQTTFEIFENDRNELEIKDIENGVTFFLDLEDLRNNAKHHDGVWRKQDTKGKGVSVTFGSKGWLQELKYGKKKRKY